MRQAFTRYLIVSACAFAGLILTWLVLSSASIGNQRKAVLQLRGTSDSLVMTVRPAKSLSFGSQGEFRELRSVVFHQNPPFLVWLALMICMVALAAGACPLLLAQIRVLRREAAIPRNVVWGSAIIAIAIVMLVGTVTASAKDVLMLEYVIRKAGVLLRAAPVNVVQCIIYVTMALVTPAVVLILLVAYATGRASVAGQGSAIPKIPAVELLPDGNAGKEELLQLGSLHRILTSSLQVLSVVIVFSVLTTTLLSAALKRVIEVRNESGVDFELFPASHAYMYGLCFSMFLAILYFPAHFLLKDRWRSRSESLWLRGSRDEGVVPEGLKALEGNPLDHLKIAFSILAPLITSILPEHINFAG